MAVDAILVAVANHFLLLKMPEKVRLGTHQNNRNASAGG